MKAHVGGKFPGSRNGFRRFDGIWEKNARLALDAIEGKRVKGIPTSLIHAMEWEHIEILSGNPPGSYPGDPVRVYRDFTLESGVCMIDQWIPENPLKMRQHGFGKETARNAATGAENIVVDGRTIDSPEAAAAHMEDVMFPRWEETRRGLEENFSGEVSERIAGEVEVQEIFGRNMLKCPYKGFFMFPGFLYSLYGYENYFTAYALYPEIIERGFKICAGTSEVYNRAAAAAIIEGGLPRIIRLDHDMADSRGTLVDINTLDKIWFPHFARSIRPFMEAGIRLLWHCDGNLMEMVPRLIEAGVGGFQGFQYEDGMDYEKICAMKTRGGNPLTIIAGVSVTTTLPFGKPGDVRKELNRLVEKGPREGLFLACSSSIAPGVPLENMKELIEGLKHYRENGRN